MIMPPYIPLPLPPMPEGVAGGIVVAVVLVLVIIGLIQYFFTRGG